MKINNTTNSAGVDGLIVFLIFIIILFVFERYNSSDFDGKYCTMVTIDNDDTTGDYQLTVDISDNRLYRIYFSNGSWLDESHFIPKEVIVESDGYCSFKDDRGRDISFILSQDEKGACER